MRRTHGDLRKLTAREKADLEDIARQLEVGRLGRDLVGHVAGVRRARRR